MTGLSFIIEGKVELIVDYDAKISKIYTYHSRQILSD